MLTPDLQDLVESLVAKLGILQGLTQTDILFPKTIFLALDRRGLLTTLQGFFLLVP